jgi:hypothetical protein
MPSEYRECPICKRWDWSGSHRCWPEWQWRIWGDGDDWCIVRARDAEEAAELAAEVYDADDYSLLGGGETVIETRAPGSETVTRWCCSGETVPRYHARQIEAK